ncbi:pre-mycofactocin synthase MftD [Pseudonocardia broussonetiae]|uniref:Mycofactocin biosynthesis FMN-dependent deaminase MftD n=1 Tax=Pseudonocardia broussonetiae TaxID=2736640 RepID=A0A6M6J9U5_9PSEU|nr:pre-mycofactocin synthase MftD [Pseudonocardia broussonetiae]QJY44624.1 mycofactocin biosynthesis FMN-dependent deaminase MftD [Pseudonocardia broussonetiae]
MASSKEWFETVAEAQRRAKKRLPRSVYLALVAGSEQGITLDDNVAAFSEIGFRPHIANLPQERVQSTTVMGQDVSLPVLISPTGVQAVTPDGEVGVARAANQVGTAMGLSSFASKPVEDVVAANPKTFFQMYWVGSRDRILQRAERARKAGAKGLIVTLDWTFATRRDWGSPPIPEKMDLKAIVQFAPEGIMRPRYVLEWARSGGLPDLKTPNLAAPGEDAPTFFGAYGEWMGTPLPTWDDIAWLRNEWDGPFAVKGIMHPDDAKRAVDAGATAISVSNHGGNNLDGTPASIRALPDIVKAVGSQTEVLLDGGIRRGGDVVKALALGAKAVMIGRAYLWGMAANGEAGVVNVLSILRSGIDEALLGLGKSSIHDLTPDDLIVPEDFTRGHRARALAAP